MLCEVFSARSSWIINVLKKGTAAISIKNIDASAASAGNKLYPIVNPMALIAIPKSVAFK
jgi:hypothetical protein